MTGGEREEGRLPKMYRNGKNKKRGVPRHHVEMLPGNSFPQICVVSGNKSVGK
jgi:hypothetical protein